MVSPRTASLVSLGAVPAVLYYALTAEVIVSVAVLNVGIIATALYLIFTPVDGGHDAARHGRDGGGGHGHDDARHDGLEDARHDSVEDIRHDGSAQA